MKRHEFAAFCLMTSLAVSIHTANAQAINATMQTTSARTVTSRAAPALAARPVARMPVAPHVAPRPASFTARTLNSYAPRMAAQSVPNILPNHSSPYIARSLNPAVAPIGTQRSARIGDQRAITLDPVTRQTELRTLAEMHQRRGVVTREGNILDPATRGNGIHKLATIHEHRGLVPRQANTPDAATRDTELRALETMRERRAFETNNQTLATIDPQRRVKNHDPETGPHREKVEAPKDAHGKNWHNKKDRIGYDDAFRRHWHEWHDRNWWHDHCDTIVFVTTGYYFLDGSYWYPAWGYDPLQSYYDYDGPVYTYSNLLPDEVIANVQTALQDAGYYYGPITGSLGVDTRAAIANFQRDYGLEITGAIDEATVEALGLY
jgi:hypothetical protein